MVSVLAFDSKTIKFLLDDKFSIYYQEEYPIFYTNMHQTDNTKTQNAIDVAIMNNQIKAVSLIIKHVIKYQNDYTSSYLFKDNLIDIMNRGINIVDLMKR